MGENIQKNHHEAEVEMTKVPLSIDNLFVGLRIPFDVYIKNGEQFIHLFTKWTHFDKRTKEILNEQGINIVYIEGAASQIEEYFKHTATAKSDTVDPKRVYEYTIKKEVFHHIDKTLLVDRTLFMPDTVINFSIFAIDNMVFETLVETSEDKPVRTPDRIFKAKGDIAIKISDIPHYQNYLNTVLSSPDIPVEVKKKSKAISLRENSKILVRNVLADPENEGKIEQLAGFVSNITDSLIHKDINVYDLMSLKSHDLYTYTHSVNVAVMSVSLAVALGIEKSQIEKLGIGAMMHDIGKSLIPPEILNRLGKLTNNEFAIMKTHVVEGVKILEKNKEIPKESLIPVLQHHEKLSGRGYPLGLSSDKLKSFGRIASIVDCYDALTTPRPYKYAYTPYMTLSLLTKETKENGDFDPDYLKLFIKTLADFTN